MALESMNSTKNKFSGASCEPCGTLRLRMPATFAIHQLAKHLPRFHALYPQIAVEVCAPSEVDDVGEGHDLTILWNHPAIDGEFIARPLARTGVIFCASPEYLDRRGRPSHPSELNGHMLLGQPSMQWRSNELSLMRADGGRGEGRYDRYAVQPRNSAAMSTMNDDLSYAGALAGLGICALPSFLIEDALMENALERVLPTWHLRELEIWVCMPKRAHVPFRTSAMLDFLIETFGDQDRDPWLAHHWM